jgi:hypothetical protein
MADKKASKSTGETPAQQRALGKSVFQIIKENAKTAVKAKVGPRNTIEKAAQAARKR